MTSGNDRWAREIQVCLFDIMGTVVDVDGSVSRDTAATLERSNLGPDDIAAVIDRYEARLDQLMGEVTGGARPWQRHRALRRLALREALPAAQLAALTPEAEDHLSSVIHRLDPWPDSVTALRALHPVVGVVGLSNADLAELTGLSRHSGLSWHALLSGELVQAFKPDPTVYQMALRLLDLEPSQVLMVAAHPWDLRAAAEHGLATAYVARPGAEGPRSGDAFDLELADLAELASLFTRVRA